MFIAFDVGETLIEYQGLALDWSAHYRPALEQALRTAAVCADEPKLALAVEILTFYNTRRNPRTFEVVAGEVTARIARLFDLAVPAFTRDFFAYFQRRAAPAAGAQELLGELRAAGNYLAALSDVPYGMPTSLLREDLGPLAGALDAVASSCDVGVRKPSGSGLRRLLDASGQAAHDACYVGNEPKDIAAARAAGMRGILLARGDDVPDCGQTHTIKALADLARLVD